MHLITDEISAIYEDGILTNGNDKKYEVDLIVYATGFSNENSLFGFETIGVIRGEFVKPLNPTLDLAQQQGMKFVFVGRKSSYH